VAFLFSDFLPLLEQYDLFPMKKLSWIFILLFTFSFISMEAQFHRFSPGITLAGKGKVNTKVDNMGYWQRMVKLGYVTPNPRVTVPKAVFTGSRILAKGIQIQDSPDICVTGTSGTTQSENSIFINPENEDELLNSNNSSDWDGSYANSLFGADDRSSEDEGISWAGEIEGTGNDNMGDPSVAVGLNGRWYAGKINNNFGQSVAWSDNQGATWHDVTVSTVPSPGQDLLDKDHLWIDNTLTSPFQGRLYDAWTNFVSGSPYYGQVEVSRSVDNGLTWTTSLAISPAVAAGSFCHGANLQTGPGGEVYGIFTVYDTWPGDESAIGFAKSLNGGSVFTPATRIINNIKGIRTSGTTKNMRVNSFPSMTVDISNGPHKGYIYIVWANIGFPGVNTGSDIDVYMLRSIDQGSTWSAPIRVNQDVAGLGKQHFFPWISCDPVTGNLCVIYYDDRNVSSTDCETWISYSYNAGDTWTDMKVSDVSFTPTPIPGLAVNYFGDYLGVNSRNMMAYPVWTDNRNGNALTYISPVNLGPAPNQPYVVYDSYELASIQKKSGQTMNYGDSLYLSLTLKNVGDQPANNVTAYLSSDSPYITITDSTEQYGNFSPGEVKSVVNGFSFKVSDTIPDGLRVKFNVRTVNADTSWLSNFRIEVHAPNLYIGKVVIHDSINGNNNGHLDPGESVDIAVTVANSGDFACPGTWIKISSPSDYLVFSVDSIYLDTILPLLNKTAVFKLDIAPDACLYSSADLHLVAGSGLYRSKMTVLETIGLLMEDWETNGFTKFPWINGGTATWFIDTIHYKGSYSARSGVIYNNSTSRLEVTLSVGKDDSISFYTKVSSEQDYDWLHFFIDDVPLGQWSGEQDWQRVSYPVTPGTHTFKWWYVTDISFLNGSNAGWIDNIVFPPPLLPNVYAGNDTTICAGHALQLQGTAFSYDSLRWTTFGDGIFSNDTILNPIYAPGVNDVSAGSVKLRLKATGANGCYSSSLNLAIAAIPVSHLTILPDDTICGGQSAHLFADTIPGGHYLWTPGGFTTPEITVDTSLTGGFGSRWFRMRIINSANCFSTDSLRVTFKDCSGIEETIAGSRYEVFPNPNDGTFKVKIRNPSPGHLTIRLQNVINLMILEDKDLKVSRDFIKTYKLNMPSGIYILTFEDNEGKTNIKMIVR
jgi:hypothetical protein